MTAESLIEGRAHESPRVILVTGPEVSGVVASWHGPTPHIGEALSVVDFREGPEAPARFFVVASVEWRVDIAGGQGGTYVTAFVTVAPKAVTL